MNWYEVMGETFSLLSAPSHSKSTKPPFFAIAFFTRRANEIESSASYGFEKENRKKYRYLLNWNKQEF